MKTRRRISFLVVCLVLILTMALVLTGCPEAGIDPPGDDDSSSGDDGSGGSTVESITISGKIIDFSDRTPLEGVSVVVSGSDIDPVHTNEEGIFELVLADCDEENVTLNLTKEQYIFPSPQIELSSEADVVVEFPIPGGIDNELGSSLKVVIVAEQDIPGEWAIRRSSDIGIIVNQENQNETTWVTGNSDDELNVITITIEELNSDLYKCYVDLDHENLTQDVKAFVFKGGDSAEIFEMSLPEHTEIDPSWELFWMKDGTIHVVNQIESEGVYMIGDLGPASGVIVFDKGIRDKSSWKMNESNPLVYNKVEGLESTESWRYLEAATEDLECPSSLEPYTGFYWGHVEIKEHISLNTSKYIGQGAENTGLINDYYGESNDSHAIAANFCKTYIQRGKDDWFLPSVDEMVVLFDYVIHMEGDINGFSTYGNKTYWSSSEYLSTANEEFGLPPDDNTAYGVTDRGIVSDNYIQTPSLPKGFSRSVRPIRRF